MSKRELDQLYLSKNEKLGVFSLFLVLTILLLVPWLYLRNEPSEIKTKELRANDLNQPNSASYQHAKNNKNYNPPKKHLISKENQASRLFLFDPNKISKEEAILLGIPNHVYSNLQKYLNAGGKIKTSQQFKEIYGMNSELYHMLYPYIQIKSSPSLDRNNKTEKIPTTKSINLNTANVEDLLPLKGIGEKLANRIIKYRNLLGGFNSKKQLSEIYGLQDSIININDHLLIIEGPVTSLNINQLDSEQLKQHPYIGFKIAKILNEYRKQHGNYTSLTDLYKVEALDSNWIKRIEAYLSFD